MTRALLLSCAALGLLAGCEADDSLPTHPRTSGLFTADEKAQQNAEQRSLEKPTRDLPTHGSDLPGQQSASTCGKPVLTLDSYPAIVRVTDFLHSLGFTGPSGWQAFGHTTGPQTTYHQDFYPGVVPHVPPDPGSIPIPGATPIPGGDFALDHSWGQSLALPSAAHRDWPEITAHYQMADATHNPTYYFNIQEHVPVKQNDGSYRADVKSGFIEIPWFFVNTAALPLLIALEPPRAKRSTSFPTADPNFNGYLPDGPVVASPVPGVLKWEYPFLNPDGTVKSNNNNNAPTPIPPTSQP